MDDVIDDYFEITLGIKGTDIDLKKYKAWLMLYEKEDSNKSLNEFKAFMQHK